MKVGRSGRSIAAATILVLALAAMLLAVPAAAQQPAAADAKPAADKASFVGSDACKGCHAKIGQGFDKNPHAKTLSESPSDDYRGCESCHGPGSLHIAAPSSSKMSNPAKLTGAEANESCNKCHLTGTDAPKSWQNLDSKYWRRGEHNRSGISCVGCHTVHGNTPHLVAKQAPEMCLTCHSQVLQSGGKKAAYTHAPVLGGMCTKCHDPHGTSARHNIVAGIQSVCTGCHKAGTADMTKAHGNVPLTDAKCTACHSAHSHDRQAKLIKTNQHMPFKSHQCGTCHKANSTDLVKPQRELCTMCHSKDLAANPTDGSHVHTAVQQGMCTGCHNPHASDAKKAYWKDEKLAYACYTCHSSIEYQVDGKFKHQPIKGQDCLMCHKPHVSKERALLAKTENDLCSQCHKDHKLMHPMNKKADGTKVIDPMRKDTLTCTSCHSPHGGQFERMAVRDWKRDLCLGCHSAVMH